MTLVRVEKNDAGFVIKPFSIGAAFGAFKKKTDADLAAETINKVYLMGQERAKGDLREFLGVAQVEAL